MTDDLYDDEFTEALRDAVRQALGIQDDFLIGGKLIALYGIPKTIAAPAAGRKISLTPRQAVALFTFGESAIFDKQNGGFSKMFSGDIQKKKGELSKLAGLFHNEMRALNPQIAATFGKHYLQELAITTKEFSNLR